jgi:UDP-glucose 4-epimerase
MRWLITGGCGFIGRNFISSLIDEPGHLIRIVDNLKVGSKKDLSEVCEFVEIDPSNIEIPKEKANRVELIRGDILDADLAHHVSKGIDVIIHLAASTGISPSVENPRMDCKTNVIGTLNYLEAARHCRIKRFVFASSGAPVGEVTPPIHEELPPHPVSPYGASKLAGEGYCSAYYHTFGLETVALRFGNVYGPLSGKKDSVIAKFIKQTLKSQPVEICGDGTQTRDFIYVVDLVRAIHLAVSTPNIGGEIFQIATNYEHTVNDVVELLKKELKAQLNIDMAVFFGARRKGDVNRNYSDTSKAKRVLDWKSEIQLEKGIEEIVDWFKTKNTAA